MECNVPDGTSVLVIDDEPSVRNLLGMLLRTHGYRVALAADGAEAHCAIETERVSLILCDVHLRGESGLAVAQDLFRRSPNSIIFMMSGDGLLPPFEKSIVGIREYIEKPFDAKDLVQRIDQALCGRRVKAPPESGEKILHWRRSGVG